MTHDEREWFERQFSQMREALQAHVLDDERRLTKLEEWRRRESVSQIQRGTWAGLLAASGLSGLVEVLKWYVHSK